MLRGDLSLSYFHPKAASPLHQLPVPPDSNTYTLRLVRDGTGFFYVRHTGDVDNLWFQAFTVA
jgi:hypothetical protein